MVFIARWMRTVKIIHERPSCYEGSYYTQREYNAYYVMGQDVYLKNFQRIV